MSLDDKLKKHKKDLETPNPEDLAMQKKIKKYYKIFMIVCVVIIFFSVIAPGSLSFLNPVSKKPDACSCASVMTMWETKGVIPKSKTELLNDCNDSYRNSNSAYTKCLEEVEDSRR
jgi:hypothetical protein